MGEDTHDDEDAETCSCEYTSQVIVVRHDLFAERHRELGFHGVHLCKARSALNILSPDEKPSTHIEALKNEDRQINDTLRLTERVDLFRSSDASAGVVDKIGTGACKVHYS